MNNKIKKCLFGHDMDKIKSDPPRFWCISCGMEFHSDRNGRDRWVALNDEAQNRINDYFSRLDRADEDNSQAETTPQGVLF